MTAVQANRDEALCERERIRTMVHHAMLTWAVMPKERSSGGSAWPAYRLEHDDWGAHEKPEGVLWQPTPRHIDEADRVQEYFGGWRGQDRKVNGLHKWEYALLLIRAQQELATKSSWRSIADAMAMMRSAPSYSHTFWKHKHDDLVEIAYGRALELGDVF